MLVVDFLFPPLEPDGAFTAVLVCGPI